jgi:hypothetical protein
MNRNQDSSVVEPEPQGAGTFSRSWYSEVLAPAPGETKVVYLIIIRIEKDQKSELVNILYKKS